jgi:hypothetical protein
MFRIVYIMLIMSTCSNYSALAGGEGHPKKPEIVLLSTERRMQRQIEKQLKEAEDEAKRTLVQEAIQVVNLTKKALAELKESPRKALVYIEQASNKLQSLLARHPEQALLPVNYLVQVIDAAPIDMQKIPAIVDRVERLIKNRNYAEARIWLNMLRSEIHTSTYCLPLAAYPKMLKEVTCFIENNNLKEAYLILYSTLNTPVLVEQTIPIPILNAKVLFFEAEEHYPHNKILAAEFMRQAASELERAAKLGYITEDEEWSVLNKSIQEILDHMKTDRDLRSFFSNLTEKIKDLLKRIPHHTSP